MAPLVGIEGEQRSLLFSFVRLRFEREGGRYLAGLFIESPVNLGIDDVGVGEHLEPFERFPGIVGQHGDGEILLAAGFVGERLAVETFPGGTRSAEQTVVAAADRHAQHGLFLVAGPDLGNLGESDLGIASFINGEHEWRAVPVGHLHAAGPRGEKNVHEPIAAVIDQGVGEGALGGMTDDKIFLSARHLSFKSHLVRGDAWSGIIDAQALFLGGHGQRMRILPIGKTRPGQRTPPLVGRHLALKVLGVKDRFGRGVGSSRLHGGITSRAELDDGLGSIGQGGAEKESEGCKEGQLDAKRHHDGSPEKRNCRWVGR